MTQATCMSVNREAQLLACGSFEVAGKEVLERIHLIIDDTFHNSAYLDLESFLVRLFAGEGRYQVLNGKAGISDSDYYARAKYTPSFQQIFELRAEGMFERSIPKIENSDLFKFSPSSQSRPSRRGRGYSGWPSRRYRMWATQSQCHSRRSWHWKNSHSNISYEASAGYPAFSGRGEF